MEAYKQGFIEFMVRSGVLTFGNLITKSGRSTPFFINTGNYDTGAEMDRLGKFYAQAIMNHTQGHFDCLFGPAYKGIPLVIATSIALSTSHDLNIPFAFNRKEVKSHGECGSIIGHKLQDGERVVIIEDVITAGTSVRESMEILRATANVKVVGLIVSVNRQERGQTARTALAELHDEFGIDTFAVVTLDEIIEHLHNRVIDDSIVLNDTVMAAIKAYRAQYGAVS